MNNVQRVAVWLLAIGLLTEAGHAGNKTYNAIVRPGSSGSSQTVSVEAKDYFEAKDRITGIYCGGTDCIVEGPWERH